MKLLWSVKGVVMFETYLMCPDEAKGMHVWSGMRVYTKRDRVVIGVKKNYMHFLKCAKKTSKQNPFVVQHSVHSCSCCTTVELLHTLTSRIFTLSRADLCTAQPPTVVCKMEAQLEHTHTHCIHVFARLAPIFMLSRCLLTKFLHRNSVGSLLRLRCWLVGCAIPTVLPT